MPTLILPKRKSTSHKGENGRVLIIGGNEEYVGAIALAGLAALRSGADLVVIAAPAKTAWAVSCLSPDLITVKLPGTHLAPQHLQRIRALAAKADVVLFGNGAGTHVKTVQLMRSLARLPERKVIDADAIKAIGAAGLRDAILTPHEKEWTLFLQHCTSRERADPSSFFARSNVVLLKGKTDTILSASGSTHVRGGNAGMTRGGTGDVLAGLVAGLWAQGLAQQQAAISASILNKRIGDALLKKHKGYSYLASDMVEEITRLRNR